MNKKAPVIKWRKFTPLRDDEIGGLRVSVSKTNKRASLPSEVVWRLLRERDAFAQAAMSASWLLEECDRAGLERVPRDFRSPTRLEKAIGATRQAVEGLEGLGLSLPQGG